MDCAEAREHLHDLNRGLADGSAEAVRVHVGARAACAEALRVDAEVRALLRTEVQRYEAPPALRARIQALLGETAAAKPAPAHPTGWRPWLLGHRWGVGGLAGAMVAILLVWAGALWLARDPIARLADRAVAEHMEYVKETMTWPAADPSAVARELKDRVGFSFGAIFPGDSQEHLVAGKISNLSGELAAAFIYRNGTGRYTTLFLMPQAGIIIPSVGGMPIETFKPYHRVVAGRQLFLWTQGNHACLLVSDLDEEGSASMFLKIRKMV